MNWSDKLSWLLIVIGGESIFEIFMPLADKLYLTRVNATIDGDRFFRYQPSQWKRVSSRHHETDAANKYAYDYSVLRRL